MVRTFFWGAVATCLGCTNSVVDSSMATNPDAGVVIPQAEVVTSRSVELRFAAKAHEDIIGCGVSSDSVGRSDAKIEFLDFRFYLHDIQLIAESGERHPLALEGNEPWQHDDLVLLDFEDGTALCHSGNPETNHVVIGSAPDQNYVGVTFRLGVPLKYNHIDLSSAPPILALTSMFWSWQSGYKFVRIDTHVEEGNPPIFSFHLGSTRCKSADGYEEIDCESPNRPYIEILGADPTASEIIFDFAKLVSDTDLKTGEGAPGCMSDIDDEDCEAVFETLGLDLQTGQPTSPQRDVFFFGETDLPD